MAQNGSSPTTFARGGLGVKSNGGEAFDVPTYTKSIANKQALITPALAPLTGYQNFVVWKGSGAPRLARDPSRFASTSDRTTWAPYEIARQAVLDGRADGIGFVLTHTRVAAFDLDDCLMRTASGFAIARQARELVERCGSYCEITPSEQGLRIIGFGNGEPVHSKFPVDDWSLEIYRGATRYIRVTGNPLPGYDQPLCNIDHVIDSVRRPETVSAPVVNASKSQAPAPACDFDEHDCTLIGFVRSGAPQGHRSGIFQMIVNQLYQEGWPQEQIEALFARYPDGLAARYRGRLGKEVERSFARAEVRYGQ